MTHLTRLTLLLAVVLLPSACVTYPATRTYYQPDAADGTLRPSSRCGYSRSANDTLERVLDEVEFYIRPIEDAAGDRVVIQVAIVARGRQFTLAPEALALRVNGSEQTLQAVAVTEQESGPVFDRLLTLAYPVAADSAAELAVQASAGYLVVAGKPQSATQYRFRRVTLKDWYYAGVNC
jgi:hypothetical protein